MYLGELIREYRKKHRMSLQAFSDRANLSKGYINQLENNRNPKTGDPIVPSAETFIKVATAMGIPVNDLYGLVDENQPIVLNPSGTQSSKNVDVLLMTDDELVEYHISALAGLLDLDCEDIRRAIDFVVEMKK